MGIRSAEKMKRLEERNNTTERSWIDMEMIICYAQKCCSLLAKGYFLTSLMDSQL